MSMRPVDKTHRLIPIPYMKINENKGKWARVLNREGEGEGVCVLMNCGYRASGTGAYM